jgi:alkylation response protein AidB-like acyl-CoA dehydrogenase
MTSVNRKLHLEAIPGRGRPAPHIPPRRTPARRITTDAEAIEVAQALAGDFAREAADRDRERRLPIAEIDSFSQSGLWAITVPRAYGGAGVSNATLAEVVAIIAAADGSLGQIPQNHFYMVEALRQGGSEEQKRRYFQRILDGDRLGNAFTEVGTRNAVEFETRLLQKGDRLVLNGQKFYSTVALFAHLILVVAADGEKRSHVVFLERSTPGLTLIDDWFKLRPAHNRERLNLAGRHYGPTRTGHPASGSVRSADAVGTSRAAHSCRGRHGDCARRACRHRRLYPKVRSPLV